jgi:Fe-S cluster assembly iron-binding protein IscA
LSLALDEPKESDKVFDHDTVNYIIDDELVKKTGDVTIEFVDMGYRSGFRISSQNPVSGAACFPGGGCSTDGACSC